MTCSSLFPALAVAVFDNMFQNGPVVSSYLSSPPSCRLAPTTVSLERAGSLSPLTPLPKYRGYLLLSSGTSTSRASSTNTASSTLPLKSTSPQQMVSTFRKCHSLCHMDYRSTWFSAPTGHSLAIPSSLTITPLFQDLHPQPFKRSPLLIVGYLSVVRCVVVI